MYPQIKYISPKYIRFPQTSSIQDRGKKAVDYRDFSRFYVGLTGIARVGVCALARPMYHMRVMVDI
jgi:hypothetical protein